MTLSKALEKTKLSKKNNVLTKINKFLSKKHNFEYEPFSEPRHSPSAFGTSCLRKIYYYYWKVPKDKKVNAKGARIFEMGDFVELMIVSWLKELGIHIPYRDLEGKIPVDKDTGEENAQFPISHPTMRIKKGFIDNIGFVDGELWLFEIKSSKGEKFEALEKPLIEHRTQGSIYFDAFCQALERGDYSHIEELKNASKPKGVKFIYVNKDNSELKEFDYLEPIIQKRMQKLLKKVEKINNYIDQGELPPPKNDKCFFCPWQPKCKKGWNDVPRLTRE